MMPQIKLVVFDVDGTLINSAEHTIRGFELVLPKYGAKFSREMMEDIVGKTLIDCYRYFAPEYDSEELVTLHRNHMETPEMYKLITLYDGLRDALEIIRSENRKTAIFTNRNRTSLDRLLDHFEIRQFFDYILSSREIEHPKPHPQGLELIASKLNCRLDEGIMVGDTDIDIMAGRNAKIAATVGVSFDNENIASLKAAEPTFIIKSLEELPKVIHQIEDDA
jgi:HAD superfamily hydrolase (TIGR01549 family)